eukprot:464654_1
MSTLEDEQDTESVGTPANVRSENNDKQNKQTIVGMRIIAGTIIIIVVIIAYFLLRDVFAIKNIIDSNCKAHYDDCNGCRCAEDRYSNTDYNDMDYNDTDYNEWNGWSIMIKPIIRILSCVKLRRHARIIEIHHTAKKNTHCHSTNAAVRMATRFMMSAFLNACSINNVLFEFYLKIY